MSVNEYYQKVNGIAEDIAKIVMVLVDRTSPKTDKLLAGKMALQQAMEILADLQKKEHSNSGQHTK